MRGRDSRRSSRWCRPRRRSRAGRRSRSVRGRARRSPRQPGSRTCRSSTVRNRRWRNERLSDGSGRWTACRPWNSSPCCGRSACRSGGRLPRLPSVAETHRRVGAERCRGVSRRGLGRGGAGARRSATAWSASRTTGHPRSDPPACWDDARAAAVVNGARFAPATGCGTEVAVAVGPERLTPSNTRRRCTAANGTAATESIREQVVDRLDVFRSSGLRGEERWTT